MKKKSNVLSTIMFVGLFAVMVCLISLSGTYAKYTTTVSGSDTAKVAKWRWTISDADVNSASVTTYTLDLFNTAIKDTDGTTAESNMSATSHMVAPGTSGAFDLEITNNSDVDATYAVTFSETNPLGAEIEYCTSSCTTASNWGTVSTLNATTTNILNASETDHSDTIHVQWRWLFSDADATQSTEDTGVGFAAGTAASDEARTITVSANVVLNQVD